ncbi:MAG: ribbon-helix-helix protein, CopG family [Myxococcaceae bacterium]
MVQVLLQLDEDTAKRLERIVPGRSRKRSEFIRRAIQKALWELSERDTERAYREMPDDEPAYFDPALWEAAVPSRGNRKASRRR